MALIDNERTKYLATFVNSIGITTIAAGVITPLVAATYGVSGATVVYGLDQPCLVSDRYSLTCVGAQNSREVTRMTFLQWYVLVGIPVLLLAMGYGAVKLADYNAREADRKRGLPGGKSGL